MKKFILLFILLIGIKTNVYAESIKNYFVDMHLQKDSSVIIEENIDYDFRDLYKHGIYRFIPNTFEIEGQKRKFEVRKIEISDVEVFRDGKKEEIAKLDEDDGNNNFFIKIGKPDETITGLHRYTIKYKVKGSLRYFDDFDEIY
jgi:hypothetical protein